MLVPMSFVLVDGLCSDANNRELYAWLVERDDVIQEDLEEEVVSDIENTQDIASFDSM